jgi:hypothetical protein
VKQVSGIKILERHPHSVPVGYVPVSGEAMVNYGSSDFRFRNDNKFGIFIYAEADHTSGSLMATAYRLADAAPPSAPLARPTVIVDGITLTFDVPPMVIDNRVYIEIRSLFESLGYAVSYNESTKESRMTRGDEMFILEKGAASSEIIRVKGAVRTVLPVPYPIKLVSDRTMFPLRFAGDLIGYDAAWNETTRAATLTKRTTPATNA